MIKTMTSGWVVLCAMVVAFILPALAQANSAFEEISGEYVIVDVRKNSFVAAPARMPKPEADSPIGKKISFTKDGVVLDGISCQKWQAVKIKPPADISKDSALTDLRLPPTDSPKTDGDKRLSNYFQIDCEGEVFTTLFQADKRVLAMSWSNSELYLILERPLNVSQTGKLQKVLKSMKFYHGALNGIFAAETARAVRAWYRYRLSDDKAAIPLRPAVTENLLDTLRVFK
jgi:hypothetical protein